jgi:hypothetical protein
MISIYLALLLAWTLVCFFVGALWEAYREDAQDMDQRDRWATEQEQRMKGAA